MEDKFKRIESILYRYKDIDKLNKITDIKIEQCENNIILDPEVKEDMINQIELLKAEKKNRILERDIIKQAIDILDDIERRIIEIRYFSKPTKTWDAISLEVNLSKEMCVKLRRKTIVKLLSFID